MASAIFYLFDALYRCKGVDLTGLLGDIKEDWRSGDRSPPAGSRGGAPVGVWGTKSPRSIGLSFFVKIHLTFALKYNKQQQQLLLLLDKIKLAAKYTFKKHIFHFQFFKH